MVENYVYIIATWRKESNAFPQKKRIFDSFFILSESVAVCNRKMCPSGLAPGIPARAFAPWISGPAISTYPPFGKFTNAYSTVFDRAARGGV